ncbi:Protein kish, partial [Dillenia turbinata]
SALFSFHSFLTVVLLGICACTYLRMQSPAILEQRTGYRGEYGDQFHMRLLFFSADFIGFRGFFWKAARIGERLSPWVALGCFIMGLSVSF